MYISIIIGVTGAKNKCVNEPGSINASNAFNLHNNKD